ncbi:cell division protein FtsL [Halomonas caseinilytica]|uniref:Cell division protein FtsL n=1 Tax=Halomonas caseinilytica TaxID=438744 RepID=A0A1M6X6P1_9GAMM|nr:cell division protein FtsL [Halomonas caseinilytica]SEM73789.1 cell division protein FtsL [Halomonas caseinilytica]SHL01598.1 cell division protein FtsL [Halomonas caseinilytica]
MAQGRNASKTTTPGFGWPVPRPRPTFKLLLNGVLVGLCLVSALAVIATSHEIRERYVRLQQLESEQQQLQTEWGQLLLEESAWSSPSRIERLASERLEMRLPDVDEVEVIRP